MGPTCVCDRELSGSVVECLTPDREAACSSLTGVTASRIISSIWFQCYYELGVEFIPSGFNAIMNWGKDFFYLVPML